MFTPPTTSERIGWAIFYSTFAAGGVVVLTLPPRTIEGPLGESLTVIWGIFWLTALIPAIASLFNRYKIEYPTMLLTIAGAVIYAFNVWSRVSETPTRATQAIVVTALVIGLSLRWLNRGRLVHKDRRRNSRADPSR